MLRIVLAVVIAAAITAVSLRLLGCAADGQRRFWPASSGGGAGVLALGLAHWDWGEEGLAIHTVAIGIPATMAAAVTLDLLARPARWPPANAGLVVVPRPFRAVRRRIDVLRRYRELLQLARREGFGPAAVRAGAHRTDERGHRRPCAPAPRGRGRRLRQARPDRRHRVDLISPELAGELAQLQNRVCPESVERIQPVLEAELGQPVDEVFAEFDWEPLAAASIGQTYRARLRHGSAGGGEGPASRHRGRPGAGPGRPRTGGQPRAAPDPARAEHAVGEVLDQFARSLRAETRLRPEVDAMEEMRTLLGPDSVVRIPMVHKELCTRRLLVQELFDGFTVADSEALAASGLRPGGAGR